MVNNSLETSTDDLADPNDVAELAEGTVPLLDISDEILRNEVAAVRTLLGTMANPPGGRLDAPRDLQQRLKERFANNPSLNW